MKLQSVNLDLLKLDESNARLHNERNINVICNSLERFGQQKPIVIDGDNVVIAGNGTLEAALKLGWEKIDVVQTELVGDEARAYALADNRTNDLSEWHFNTLVDELGKLDDSLIEDIGWNPDEIETLLTPPDDLGDKSDDEDFKEVSPEGMNLDRTCPKCGFSWSE